MPHITTGPSSLPFTTHLHKHTCTHADPARDHPSITSYTLTLTLSNAPEEPEVGTLTAHLLATSPADADLWSACRAFDAAHTPQAKLHKMENYLSIEGFCTRYEESLEKAGWVLFVDQMVLRREWRGRGWGLLGVDALIEALGTEAEEMGDGVEVLEPGPIGMGREGGRGGWEGGGVIDGGVEEGGSVDAGGDGDGEDVADATERIARHWLRMGFAAWSYTVEAWLLLSTRDRPAIGDVVAALQQERGRAA